MKLTFDDTNKPVKHLSPVLFRRLRKALKEAHLLEQETDGDELFVKFTYFSRNYLWAEVFLIHNNSLIYKEIIQESFRSVKPEKELINTEVDDG